MTRMTRNKDHNYKSSRLCPYLSDDCLRGADKCTFSIIGCRGKGHDQSKIGLTVSFRAF